MKAVTLTLFAMCIFSLTISAKKMSKEEEKMLDTVVVTTSDGSVHNGTVKKYWTAHHGGGYNKEFSIVTNDGSELKFNAADIDSIYFPMRDDGMLKVWRVYDIAVPKLFKKNKAEHWIAAEGGKSEHARVVVPVVRVNVPHGTRSVWETATWGCLLLDNDSVACTFFFDKSGGLNLKFLKSYLSKRAPELYNHIDAWFKSDKNRKKALSKNYALILEAVEDYYRQKPR